MIKLSGTLIIRIISGRNGDFRVGRLHADIGEFAVKDAVLDQYEEGSYEGEFGVTKIFPSYYSAAGRLVVEVRAELGSIALININPLEKQENLLEQDPLDEEKPSTPKPKHKAKPLPTDSASAEPETVVDFNDQSDSQTSPDVELFGLLWPLSDQIKLDPTVDRNLFRQQRDRLKSLGYIFKPVGQTWFKQ